MFKFEIIKKDPKSHARVGKLHTPHGVINTPCFMPVGTQATVKTLTPEMVEGAGADVILANTYHLSLRPGGDLIEEFGGLHDFMNWKKPILTDSGGYQVFSLANTRKITDNGVTFQSHIDGSKHHFTPQSVIDLQRQFNSDIMMPLDICTPYPATKKDTADDMKITHRWEREAFDYWQQKPNDQWLFSIVQGGMYKDLRQESAEILSQLDFPGFAIGGVSVGEPLEQMHEMISTTAPLLPENKPKYVMGIGLPENLDVAIQSGVDMFDCVLPTRLARHGQVFSEGQRITIRNEQYKQDKRPIDETCTCPTCTNYSRAYLRHLFVAKETLGLTLMSLHNVHYLIQYVKNIRRNLLG